MEYPKPNGVEHEIMRLLAQRREMYGLEMVKGSPRIKRGTVYVTLMRMEDKGWVTSRAEEEVSRAGMTRRLYSISGLGVAALHRADAVAALATTFVPQGAH